MGIGRVKAAPCLLRMHTRMPTRLHGTTRSYSLQLQAAADVFRAISTMLDQETLMAEVVDLIGRRFGFPYVGLFLWQQSEAVLKAAMGETGAMLLEKGYSLTTDDASPVIKAIHVGRVVVDQAVQESHEFAPLPALLAETRSQLALPLSARGQIIGALDIHSHEPGDFAAEEMTVLQTLAEQVAVALDNASLFSQVQDNYLRVNHLYIAGRHINSATSSDGIFQGLIDYVAMSRNVDGAFLISSDPGSTEYFLISHQWGHVASANTRQKDRLQQPRLLAGDIWKPSEPILIEDIHHDPRLEPEMQAVLMRRQIAACAILPVGTDGQWESSLVLTRTQSQPFSQETLQPYLSLCSQAGVALNNFRLLRETNALYYIGQTLNQALTIEDALLSILEQVARYTGISLCRVILYDEQTETGRETHTYDLHSSTSKTISLANGPLFPMQEGTLYSRLALTTTPILCVAGEDACPPDVAAFLAHHKLDALLCVPIRVQQHLLGFLALDSINSDRPFTLSNRNFVQNAVAQLTTYLENLSLFDEATKRAQDLIQINQVGTRLAGILDMDRLLAVLYEEVNRLLNLDIYFLARYRPDQETYTILSHMIEGKEPFPPGEKKQAMLLSTQIPNTLLQGGVVTGAAAGVLADEFQTYRDRPPQSLMWVAWQEENRPAGFIGVQSYKAQAYSQNDEQLLRSIATQAGLAITNARLFQQTQDNVAEFRLLFTIAQEATARVDAAERLESMVRAIHQGLQEHTIAIYRISSSGDHLELLAHAGKLVPRPILSFQGGLTGQVARLMQPLIVNQLSELPHYEVEIEGARAQLSAPLSVGQNLVGVVSVAAGETDVFTERDLRLLETLSVSLAATIESTRLFASIQATNERLRELDQLKNRFLANMTHELRTPLNAIIGFSRVILKEIDGPITKEQAEDLTAIYENGQQLLFLINDVLDLAKIEAGKITLVIERVDLQKLLLNIAATIRGLLHDKPISLNLRVEPDVPHIEGDEIRLRQILLNLLSNAAKYTSAGEIKCHISQMDEEHVLIVISDTGIGIAPTYFGRLFRAFEQADSTSHAGQGTGLGLPISKSLVEMHNGRIWFESELGKGSTFYVLLPIRQPESGVVT